LAKVSFESLILSEKNMLAYLYKFPQAIPKVSDDFLVSDEAVAFYLGLLEIKKDGASFTRDKLVIGIHRIDNEFKIGNIDSVLSTEVNEEDFTFLYRQLRENYAKKNVEQEIKDISVELSKKSEVDWDRITSIGSALSKNVSIIEGKQDYVLTLDQITKEYEMELAEREGGGKFYDTGCEVLNTVLTEGFSDGKITTIIGYSGTGKSTFAQYLVNLQINKRIPSVYISKEMPKMSNMDRFMGQRTDRIIKEFYPDEETESIPQYVKDSVHKETLRLKRNKYFRYVDHPSLTIGEVEKIVMDAKREMGVENLIVTIDLASMLKDFNLRRDSRANEYEDAMNSLHRVARDTGCHFVCVFQLKRPDGKVSIKEPEDLDKFRPTKEMIKNSGAIEERSRTIIGIHYPMNWARLHLDPDNPYLDMIDTCMEVQILKQNMGRTGQVIKYDFQPEKSKLMPVYSGEEQ